MSQKDRRFEDPKTKYAYSYMAMVVGQVINAETKEMNYIAGAGGKKKETWFCQELEEGNYMAL